MSRFAPVHESPAGYTLMRLAALALAGPLFAVIGQLGGGLGTKVWAGVALAIVALMVSRALILRDVDVARRLSEGTGKWLALEGFVIFFAITITAAVMQTGPAVGLGGGMVAGVLWAAGYSGMLGTAARSQRHVDDEPRLIRRIQLSALVADLALLIPTLTILEQLRQESLNSGHLGELIFIPLVGWIPFGMVYVPVARFRVTAVGGHVKSELLVLFSSYYAFMLTPPPAAL